MSSNLNGRLKRLENSKAARQARLINKLIQAVEDGRVTIDQVAERWPNLARVFFKWEG